MYPSTQENTTTEATAGAVAHVVKAPLQYVAGVYLTPEQSAERERQHVADMLEVRRAREVAPR